MEANQRVDGGSAGVTALALSDTVATLVDELKATAPIWKHQRFADGTDEWVGSA